MSLLRFDPVSLSTGCIGRRFPFTEPDAYVDVECPIVVRRLRSRQAALLAAAASPEDGL